MTAIYAVCFVAITAGLAFAPPPRFAGPRALIAGVALLGLVIALRQPLLPARRGWSWLVALALSATIVGVGAMFLSPGRTGADIASILANTQPIVVVVRAWAKGWARP